MKEARNIFTGFVVIPGLVFFYGMAHPTKSDATAHVVDSKPPVEQKTISEPLTRFITVKVSHYWPDLGGVNCYTFKNGKCVSRLANGEKWEKNAGIAIACPPELKFGTRIRIMDREWVCKDRGSAIVKDGNKYWVDMLLPEALVPYGKELEAEMYLD